jgi:hypothetical protein
MIRRRLVAVLFVIITLSLGAVIIWRSQRHDSPPIMRAGTGNKFVVMSSSQPDFNRRMATDKQRHAAMLTVTAQLQAIHRGDFQKALSFSTDAMAMQMGSAEHFKMVVGGPHGRYPKYIQFVSVAADECIAFPGSDGLTIHASAHNRDGSVSHIIYLLARQGATYRIAEMDQP